MQTVQFELLFFRMKVVLKEKKIDFSCTELNFELNKMPYKHLTAI